MRVQKCRAVARVEAEVWRPEIISTPFCTGTGFMKCVLTTREGPDRSVGSEVVAAAILVMLMLEVLVARMAWEGQMRASWEKILVFRSEISWREC